MVYEWAETYHLGRLSGELSVVVGGDFEAVARCALKAGFTAAATALLRNACLLSVLNGCILGVW